MPGILISGIVALRDKQPYLRIGSAGPRKRVQR